MSAEDCDFSNLLVLQSVVIIIFILLFLVAVAFNLWIKSDSLIEGYANCMVDTYFYGYLQKVVPDHLGLNIGIVDHMKAYKTKHNLTDDEFPFEKLFVVIPASGYVPPIIQKNPLLDPDGRIELRQPMESKEMNQAGVTSRPYKTSVYKIMFRGEQKHFTVIMEGAPPVLRLWESCKENPRLKAQKRKIIDLFYTKLNAKLKENHDFENACELIFFDDEHGKNNLADSLISKYLEGNLNN